MRTKLFLIALLSCSIYSCFPSDKKSLDIKNDSQIYNTESSDKIQLVDDLQSEKSATKQHPKFEKGNAYFIAKDTAIISVLFTKFPPLEIEFNSRVTITEILNKDTINGQIFDWLKIAETSQKIPSLFLSSFKFPYVEDGQEIKRVSKDGSIYGGKTGLNISPPYALDNLCLYWDNLGWQESENYLCLSDGDGETSWVKKGPRIIIDSLSFFSAVQLFFHIAHPYDKGLNLQQNYIINKDVKIWYATYLRPQYKIKGFCRVIERNGYVQILAEESTTESLGNFQKNSDIIKKLINQKDFDNYEWIHYISGDDFYNTID